MPEAQILTLWVWMHTTRYRYVQLLRSTVCSICMLNRSMSVASKTTAVNWTQLSLSEHATAQGWSMPKCLCSSLCNKEHICPAHYMHMEPKEWSKSTKSLRQHSSQYMSDPWALEYLSSKKTAQTLWGMPFGALLYRQARGLQLLSQQHHRLMCAATPQQVGVLWLSGIVQLCQMSMQHLTYKKQSTCCKSAVYTFLQRPEPTAF